MNSFILIYSCVYKCVCKQFSERLYNDLLAQITGHLERLCLHLQVNIRVSRVLKYIMKRSNLSVLLIT